MKKLLFLLLLLIPLNVDALTFDRCGSSVEVTDDNFVYYLYSVNDYKQYMTDTDYFMINKINANGRYSFLSSDSTPWRDNNGCYSASWKQINFNTDYSVNYISANRFGSNCAFNTQYQTFMFHNFDFKDTNGNNIIANITIQDLEDYFTCSSPPHFETKNEVFTNFLSQLVGYIPYILVFILVFEGVGWFINKKD